MNSDSRSFTNMIGGARLWVFLTHSCAIMLGILLHRDSLSKLAPLFLCQTIIARLFAENLFWKRTFPKAMDQRVSNRNWRDQAKGILLSSSSSRKGLTDLAIDTVIDVVLLYLAYKSPAAFTVVLLVYCLGQGIGSIFQVIAIRVLGLRKMRIFSMAFTAVTTLILLELSGHLSIFYTEVFGLSHFSVSTGVLLAIGMKSFLSGTSIIAETRVAESIFSENIDLYLKRGT